jgi:regulation of enolase protein 1 (concanavalin A-like superfamily)
MTQTTLDGFPAPLRWFGTANAWYSYEGGLTIGAGPETDLFVDPLGDGVPVVNAPRLLTPVDGDVQLSALVGVDFAATFDAAALVVWGDETNWAKLCFEQSPQGRPTIVSVVTRGHSDDANGPVVEGKEVWLRVSRLGNSFAFHSSADGRRWDLVRYFALYPVRRVCYGFEAQSPTGRGCTAWFHNISLRRERLAELRDGS